MRDENFKEWVKYVFKFITSRKTELEKQLWVFCRSAVYFTAMNG